MADMKKLDALGGMTDEIDSRGPPTPEQQEAAQALSDAEKQAMEWGMVAFTIGGALSMFAPELKQVYTQESCLKWGESVVPVAVKYGWNGPGNVPELGLLLSTAALVVPTVFVIRARLQEPPAKDDKGMVAAVKNWWRELKAKRAAKVVGDAVQAAEEGAHGLGT